MTALIIGLILINALLLGVILGLIFGLNKKDNISAIKPEPPIICSEEFEKINSLYRNFLNYDGSEQP